MKDHSDDQTTKPPIRKYPARGVFPPLGETPIVFVTAVTHHRKPWLATPEIHSLLLDAWQAADAWLVGRYVVMPDHVHLFVSPSNDSIPLESWVRHWKTSISRTIRDPERRWQKTFWDHRLRSSKSYSEKWDYVVENPVRAGLVATAEEWPYQGELNVLM